MASCVDSSAPRRGFGGYTKHFWTASVPYTPYNKLSWVNRRYTPADLRSRIPAQAHKFQGSSRPPSSVEPCWVPRPEPPPKRLSLWKAEGGEINISSPSPAAHSLEWSTLREMLPSRGHQVRKKAEKWGTSEELALPSHTQNRPNYFPKINSLMTR